MWRIYLIGFGIELFPFLSILKIWELQWKYPSKTERNTEIVVLNNKVKREQTKFRQYIEIFCNSVLLQNFEEGSKSWRQHLKYSTNYYL